MKMISMFSLGTYNNINYNICNCFLTLIIKLYIFRPKTESDNTDQSAVPSIAPPPKVPTSLFQETTPSRFNPFDQEPNETNYKNQGIRMKNYEMFII